MGAKRNSAIVCCRTVSMLMIVLCHIIGFYTFIPGSQILGQILNVGVYTFLGISGYLYGGKTIRNFGTWMLKRWIAVGFPATIITIAVVLVKTMAGIPSNPISLLVHLFNLQGIGFLNYGFYRYFTEIPVLGPLWFVTVIMLCYCLIPLLQRQRDVLRNGKYGLLAAVRALVICYILALYEIIILFYFLTFTIGYILALKREDHLTHPVSFIFFSIIMLALQILRLVLVKLYDGTSVYQAYTYLSHMVLGLWILCFFFWLQQVCPKQMEKIAANRWTIAANDISLYVYLTHYCFCSGALNMYKLFDGLFPATLAFAGSTIVAALILKKITAFFTSVLSPKV